MKLIKQKNLIDCGIACAAMFCNCSYHKALSFDINPNSSKGLSINELKNIVLKIKLIKLKEYRPTKYLSLSKNKIIFKSPSILLIRHPKEKYGHWICYNNNKIYEPNQDIAKIYNIKQYPRKSWLLIRILS
jgi:hypothetical protein